jgi:ribonucleoside-triphosphate reductase
VGYTDDPFEALELQEELQRKYTGGTVFHLYLGEPVSSADACRKLVRRVLESYRIPYLTITPTFSICPKHGYWQNTRSVRCVMRSCCEEGGGG